jgi:hypothetical protein
VTVIDLPLFRTRPGGGCSSPAGEVRGAAAAVGARPAANLSSVLSRCKPTLVLILGVNGLHAHALQQHVNAQRR